MLYEDATRYDALYGSFHADIPLYLDVCRTAGGAVCEFACGSGRVGIPLLQAGLEYSGIDLSPAMISAARAAAVDRVGPHAAKAFRVADMTEYVCPGAYAAIIIPLHSFSHVTDGATVRRMVTNVVESLEPGGVLLLAIHNPTAAWLESDPEALYPLEGSDGWFAPAHTYERVRFDGESRVATVTWFFDDGAVHRFDLRLYNAAEITDLLEENGLAVEGHWGWYDRSPLLPDSGTQVVLSRRLRQTP